jgi:hypothetical protein
MTRVLYLYGLSSKPGGYKAAALRQAGFQVKEPVLPMPDWRAIDVARLLRLDAPLFDIGPAREIAQEAADKFEPDVIVGSSLGGAVGITIQSPAARVLIAPAVECGACGIRKKILKDDRRIGARTVILHARRDELVPFEVSEELLQESETPSDLSAAAEATIIERELENQGYATHHGRLIRIGRNHQCNDPDPNDTWNRDPSPHGAMIAAVMILTGL